jgi:hypothetical protein
MISKQMDCHVAISSCPPSLGKIWDCHQSTVRVVVDRMSPLANTTEKMEELDVELHSQRLL